MKKILFILFAIVIVFADEKGKEKKFNKKKKNKKEIIFNNDENTDDYLEMYNKSFDLLLKNYVDSINETEIIKSGIKGLMKPLDPYTKLLEGSSKESYDMLKSGKYGGVGIQIGLRRDTLTVLSPMEDSPAYTEGIYAGDQILMIDSTSTEGMTVKEAADLIKGDLGTVVRLAVFRPYSKEKINFDLKRDNITVKHVPYWGIQENDIGYIRVTKFSKNAAKDFKKGLLEISKYDNLKGVIIDLRGNSGGLLSNAIKIIDYLIERGEVVLSSKGKNARSNKTWKSRNKPIISIDVPLAVLVNRSSASASEIVAGALQDLDRAIIIGQKSFGKGLVQHMYSLNDTIDVKITTAKYYLPSGRLIQKEDYLDNGFLTDGLNENDSIFYSKGGRELYGGGGITPDVKTDVVKFSPYVNSIWKEGAFLSFAAYYVPINKNISLPVQIDNKIMKKFKAFLNEYQLEYTLKGEKEYLKLKDEVLESSISINKYSKNISYNYNQNDNIVNMDNYFKQLRSVQFSLKENQIWIKNGLKREFSKVLSGESERIKSGLDIDQDFKIASDILLNQKEYYKLLGVSEN